MTFSRGVVCFCAMRNTKTFAAGFESKTGLVIRALFSGAALYFAYTAISFGVRFCS